MNACTSQLRRRDQPARLFVIHPFLRFGRRCVWLEVDKHL